MKKSKPKQPKQPKPVDPASDERIRFQTTLDRNLITEVRVRCLREGLKVNDVIEEALRKWVRDWIEKMVKEADERNARKNETANR